MSFVSLLNNDALFAKIFRDHLPTKKDFITSDGLKPFNLQRKCLAPSRLTSYSAGLSGSLFDYTARLLIAKRIGAGYEQLFYGTVPYDALESVTSLQDHYRVIDKELFTLINKLFKDCEATCRGFLKGSASIDDAIQSLYIFARLDIAYRMRLLDDGYDYAVLTYGLNNEVFGDVRRLVSIFHSEFLNKYVQKDSYVLFSPDFSLSSFLLGGAEGDLFVDGMLVDFKSTKSSGYKWSNVAQILGYYYLYLYNEFLLYSHSKLKDETYCVRGPKIKEVCLYQARFGVVESFKVSNIPDSVVIETLYRLDLYIKNLIGPSFLAMNPEYANMIVFVEKKRNQQDFADFLDVYSKI